MRDRQPTRPRRIHITPENGAPAYYGTIDMADEPYEGFEGTEWNKANVLPDYVAEKIGLNPAGDPTPADAFEYLASGTRAHPFTIPLSAWEESTAHEGYAYEAALSIIGIVPGDLVQAFFDRASRDAAVEAGVDDLGDTIADAVMFYAEAAPEIALTGQYIISKGVASDVG